MVLGRPLTVLHLIESLGRGGAERRLVNDLRYLDRRHFNNLVCTLRPPHDLADEVRALGVPVQCLGIGSLRGLIPGVWRLRALLARQNVHILHTQLFPADVLGRMSRLVRRTPILVTTLQSSVYEPGTEYLYSKRMRFVDGLTGRIMNDAFVAVSAFVRESAVKYLGFSPDQVTVIYNSVDPMSFRDPDPQRVNKLRHEIGVNPGDPVLLTIARLDPPKGHRFLFQAVSEIRRAFPTIKLLVVGDGLSRTSLEALCRDLDLKGNIEFTGTRSDVRELLAIADVFVLPTLSEGLPLTLLEALAAGVPAVMSRIGPAEEVITDGVTGLLVPPRSPSDLATAILHLLNHPNEARAIGERGQLLVSDKFSARRSADSISCLYETLAAGLT